ncbi:hypothetical protein B0H11DRAFT_2118764 [Mycena galericulata]|nr:hypothetical protein B0H11DRAFT_2118764 [Mycena galericulata]
MKTVHFSTTNTLYSPLPWSPSSGASASSLPPSPSLIPTPIPVESPPDEEPNLSIEAPIHPGSLASPAPAPLVYSPWPAPLRLRTSPRQDAISGLPGTGAAQIHFLLSFSPFTPPSVAYDVSHPLHTLNPQLTPSFLDPATFPPLPSLALQCRHLEWPISVSPSQHGGYVSVIDVLTSVYTSLRLAVRRPEYDALPSGDARQSVDDAYFTRCRLLPDGSEREIEALKGIKRVDFLAGKTRFLGLSGPLQTVYMWELNVS